MGCVGPVGQTTNGRLGAHHLIIRTLVYCWISHGWRLLGRISCETHAQSTVIRVMHVKLPSICSWPLCRESGLAMRLRLYLDRSLAMCLLKPSSLPQCVLAYPMCLRNASSPLSKVSSQCVCASHAIVCASQCVFTMRQRLPMCLRLLSLF